ncbi:type 1 fimbrial protein [Trinickia violacea]|uniref:Type 1 fimbrial protein n=1 Tax=Trinickia violacea TaxID=2571746 RepID=A0A4P8ISF9_9BURK|nr:fimbrial protein [Trinickia violacea]QCP51171.1 type 1 fimbrial protein [Trinickia violacea]
MNLKFNRIAQTLAALTAVASAPAAMAADGTITFTGTLNATTCTITAGGGGTGTKNIAVEMPTVSASSLSASGDTAGLKPFSIKLSGCTGDATSVATHFENSGKVDQTTNRLKLDTGTGAAENVQIELLNKDRSQIKIAATSGNQESQKVALTGGGAQLDYHARYVATGVAKAGSVNTSIAYSLEYQ